mmetsp:Transcript_64001/g.166394  ORF Transcript_64001/g.166394 Transcript_64001/m.166394 type:complete len:81 (+) Transcript_64001:113-355(+)
MGPKPNEKATTKRHSAITWTAGTTRASPAALIVPILTAMPKAEANNRGRRPALSTNAALATTAAVFTVPMSTVARNMDSR